MSTSRPEGVTVVLPTWNRPEGLRRALQALSAQHDPGVPWDVVVVASGRDPAAHEVVSRLPFPSPFDLRVVDEANTGASNARNRGLAEARGVVAFLDDDCWPEPEWLSRVTAPVLAGQWAGAGGRVRLDPAVRPPRWLGAALLPFLAEYDRGEHARPLDDEDYVLTANAAFDADALSQAGGFDPALGPDAGAPMVDDDVDICRKVRSAGGRIGYVPDAVVTHELSPERLRARYLLRRMYAQGSSDWLLERGRLASSADRGLREAAQRLVSEQRAILRQGPWHRSVALHSAGSLCRAAGFSRSAASALVSRRGRRRRGEAVVRPAGRG